MFYFSKFDLLSFTRIGPVNPGVSIALIHSTCCPAGSSSGDQIFAVWAAAQRLA